jgi:hypothetical protein
VRDEELLKQVLTYRPPAELHPIAGLTYDLYDEAGFVITDGILDRLREELRPFESDFRALTDALAGLCAFIMYALQDLEDEAAAQRIVDLIKEVRPKYQPIWTQLGNMLQDASKKTLGALSRFSGFEDGASKNAPRHDADRPAGTIPLRVLKPVAHPPPPRNRAKAGTKPGN